MVRVARGEVAGRVRGLQVLQLALVAGGAVHALHAVLAERAGVEPRVAGAVAGGEGRAVVVAGHVPGELAGAAGVVGIARGAVAGVERGAVAVTRGVPGERAGRSRRVRVGTRPAVGTW